MAYSKDDRDFHADRFYVASLAGLRTAPHVLLIDDTWTTGGRIQSLAYALKAAGAARVAAIVLGRHVNSDHKQYEPARQLIERIRAAEPFDTTRCAVDDIVR